MKKLRCARLKFDNSLKLNEIPAFRAALSNLYPEKSVWQHHHLDNKKLLYHYPLIQHKVYQNKLYIIALEGGADIVLNLIASPNQTVQVYDHSFQLNVESVSLFHHVCQAWDKVFVYKIYNWMALNSENYQKFQNTELLREKVAMLEKLMTAHIMAFIQHLQCNIYDRVFVGIHRIHAQKWIKYKKIDFLTFDVTFETNISLPDYIGLGKASSVGFGMVKRVKKTSLENLSEEKYNTYPETIYISSQN